MMTLPLALRRVVDNRLTKQQAVEIWMAAYYGVGPASNGDAWERAHKNAVADLWMIFSGPGDNPRMAWVMFEPFINLGRMHDLDLARDINFVHVRSEEMAEKFTPPNRQVEDGTIHHTSRVGAPPKNEEAYRFIQSLEAEEMVKWEACLEAVARFFPNAIPARKAKSLASGYNQWRNKPR